MARRLAILTAVMLAGCATTTPPPRVEYREVLVPVPQFRELPAELRTCATSLPRVTFLPTGNAAVPTGLNAEGEAALQVQTGTLLQCVRALLAWATEPR